MLDPSIQLDWRVVETIQMVGASKTLENKELSFYGSLTSAMQDFPVFNLCIASSVFQYTPDPMKFLAEVLDINAEHLFITRTALTDMAGPLIYVQKSRLSDNGPGPMPDQFVDGPVHYPITIVNREIFRNRLKESYDLDAELIEDRAVHNFNGIEIDQYGYLGKRK